MSSPALSELLDLDRDLPTTPEDVAALRRCRAALPLDTAGYLRLLGALPKTPGFDLRKRRGPGGEPFDLLVEHAAHAPRAEKALGLAGSGLWEDNLAEMRGDAPGEP